MSSPINFFDLPQELRDGVYDLCYSTRQKELWCGMFSRFQVPLDELRLVSRRFKHEYDQRISAQDWSLKMYEAHGKGSSLVPTYSPDTKFTTTVEINTNILHTAADLEYDAGLIGAWIERILECMPAVKEVTINCHFAITKRMCPEVEEFIKHIDLLEVDSRGRKISVYGYQMGTSEAVGKMCEHVSARWIHGSGLVVSGAKMKDLAEQAPDFAVVYDTEEVQLEWHDWFK